MLDKMRDTTAVVVEDDSELTFDEYQVWTRLTWEGVRHSKKGVGHMETRVRHIYEY